MLTIAVIDDNKMLRDSVKRILTAAGYRVRDFGEPESAIEYFRAHCDEVSLLLVDGMMPRMAGPEVAAAILALRPQLPVLLMSGHPASVFSQYFSAPSRHFIAKPFAAADLIRRIAALIGEGAPLPLA